MQQQAFGYEADAQRAGAEALRPDIDWQRQIAATNVTTANQAKLADLGYTTQLQAANAQAQSNVLGGIITAGASYWGQG